AVRDDTDPLRVLSRTTQRFANEPRRCDERIDPPREQTESTLDRQGNAVRDDLRSALTRRAEPTQERRAFEAVVVNPVAPEQRAVRTGEAVVVSREDDACSSVTRTPQCCGSQERPDVVEVGDVGAGTKDL